jgi:hypothetical protein
LLAILRIRTISPALIAFTGVLKPQYPRVGLYMSTPVWYFPLFYLCN